LCDKGKIQNLASKEVTNRARVIVKRDGFLKGFRILFPLLQKSIQDFAFWGKHFAPTDSAARPQKASAGETLRSRFEEH
jgi:hypothetical protein